MPKNQTIGNLALARYDDIFSVGRPECGDIIQSIPITELFPPELHPFNVTDDDAMYRLADSIKQCGVREPGLARPRADGGYELICGNRRKRGCELAEILVMPIIVRELDDASAALVMVESNLQQREIILLSERALAYSVMMDALNHNGIKGENHSYEIMFERTGVKKSKLFRVIRLTELIAPLIDMVDLNKLAFNPAVEISYLDIAEQTAVADAMAAHEIKPSLSQAKRLKELKKDGKLTIDVIDRILAEEKKPPKNEPTSSVRFRKYFPPDYTQKQMDSVIVKLLKDWKAENSA